MLVKKDVLVLNGQKLVQGMQVHKKLMLKIMSKSIAAHHLLCLFVQLAIDKNQWLMQLIADVQNRTDAISRAAAEEALEPLTQQPMTPAEVNHARRQHNLPLDSEAETEQPVQPKQEPMNFRITDDDLGAGGPKTKYKANVEAIRVLQTLDAEQRQATAEEQEILSRYVGWGGIPQAFDESNAEWSKEHAELQSLLTADEYKEARASTLNAFYTSPTVIKAMYEALGYMGLYKGNVLEPSCGVGNFMGLVPDSMEKIRMYGVELDSISGRIAQQLYQKNKIAVQGFETMQFPDSFFDCVVGNVPFGNYKVPDKRYDRHNFLIHDYFIAKSLDLVRPGGVVAVVTSSGTMDKKDSSVREYLANRADLVGAIRLPNNAFQRNANTGVVADILFLQKRDRAAVERADWVDLGETPEGYSINQYFAQHPEMVLGEITTESTQYGKQETTVKPIEGADLARQLKEAVGNIQATITEPEISDDELDVQEEPIPADPRVKNFSFTNVDTLYNKDFTERDGGILETDGDKPVREAMTELLAEFGCDAAEGKVMDAAELREQANTVAEQQAEVLKEKLAAERPAPEETLSFYVAECLEFTFAGEFHDHLTMEEALEAYDKIPSERMNADKCIGFCIEEDGGFVGMYELVVNDKVQRENINSINYFRDDKLVQQAISDMEKLMEARQKSKEQERSSTKKSVLDALRSLKAKKQEQPAQEQDKPKKAKKKGMEL